MLGEFHDDHASINVTAVFATDVEVDEEWKKKLAAFCSRGRMGMNSSAAPLIVQHALQLACGEKEKTQLHTAGL